MKDQRIEALKIAQEASKKSGGEYDTPEKVIERASAYLEFINLGDDHSRP